MTNCYRGRQADKLLQRAGGGQTTEGAGRTNCYTGRLADNLLQRAPGGQTVTRRAWRTIYYRGRLADKLLHKTLGGQSVTEGARRTKCYIRRLDKFRHVEVHSIFSKRAGHFWKDSALPVQMLRQV